MAPELKLRVHDGWRKRENPGGPATYFRGNGPKPSALQFSAARPRPGVVHHTSGEELISMCEKLTHGVKGRIELSRASGKCGFGIFGTLAVKGSSPAYMQAWVLSNHNDFILVTHICETSPDAQEMKEVNEIALLTGLS